MRRSWIQIALFVPLMLASLGLHLRQEAPDSEVVTLYGGDAISSTLSLATGEMAAGILEGEIDLTGAQLAYGILGGEELATGFARDEVVAIVDLGELLVAPIRRATDPAYEVPINAFHTLALDGGRFVYRDADGDLLRWRAADAVLGISLVEGPLSFSVEVGHAYLVRWREARGSRVDRIAKILVVDHRPRSAVTLRWALLTD